MLVGQIVGIIRMILDFVYPKPTCGTPDTRPSVVAKVNFMYFSAGLLVFTGTLVVVFSLLTKKQENKVRCGEGKEIWIILFNRVELISVDFPTHGIHEFHNTMRYNV